MSNCGEDEVFKLAQANFFVFYILLCSKIPNFV